MREIKFRAWNKNKIINWDDLIKYDSDGSDYDLHAILSGDEHLELMQYTGLKDKNGKEIYEGDIITKQYGDHTVNLEIKWDDYGGFSELYCGNEIQVIGNIYENPELLD